MANTNHRTWQKHRIGYFLASVHLDPIADGHSLEHDAHLAERHPTTRRHGGFAPVAHHMGGERSRIFGGHFANRAFRRGSRTGHLGRRQLAGPHGRPNTVCARVGPPRFTGSWCGHPCEDAGTTRRISGAAHRPGGEAANHRDLGSSHSTRFEPTNVPAAGHSLRRLGVAAQRMPAGGSWPVYSGRMVPLADMAADSSCHRRSCDLPPDDRCERPGRSRPLGSSIHRPPHAACRRFARPRTCGRRDTRRRR